MRFWLTILMILVADQLSKFWIGKEMELYQSIPVIDGVFSLTYILNKGAAFGILQGKSTLFLIIAAFIIMVLIYINFQYDLPRWVQYSMGMIVGGTLGNVIDRWFIGAVRDFFSVGWWPVFNIADIAIVIGGTLLVLYIFFNDLGQEPQLYNR